MVVETVVLVVVFVVVVDSLCLEEKVYFGKYQQDVFYDTVGSKCSVLQGFLYLVCHFCRKVCP